MSDYAYLDDDMARFGLWEGDLRFLYHFGAAILGDGDGVNLGRVCHGCRTWWATTGDSVMSSAPGTRRQGSCDLAVALSGSSAMCTTSKLERIAQERLCWSHSRRTGYSKCHIPIRCLQDYTRRVTVSTKGDRYHGNTHQRYYIASHCINQVPRTQNDTTVSLVQKGLLQYLIYQGYLFISLHHLGPLLPQGVDLLSDWVELWQRTQQRWTGRGCTGGIKGGR